MAKSNKTKVDTKTNLNLDIIGSNSNEIPMKVEPQRKLERIIQEMEAEEQEQETSSESSSEEETSASSSIESSNEESDDEKKEDDEDEEILEDDEGVLVNPDIDAQVLKTWILLRKKDPKIYDQQVKFYDESTFQAAEKAWLQKVEAKKAQRKAITLSDLTRTKLAQGIIESESEESEFEHETNSNLKPSSSNTLLPLVQEQVQLKKAFLEAVQQQSNERNHMKTEKEENPGVGLPFTAKKENHAFPLKMKEKEKEDENDDDDEDGFFVVKEKTEEELAQEERTFQHQVMSSLSKDEANFIQMLTQTNQSSPEDEFLLNYVLNKRWIDHSSNSISSTSSSSSSSSFLLPNETKDTLLQDVKEIEATERFEQEYNLRFEQTHLLPCPRDVPTSLRQKKETRKLARQRKKEREQALKQQFIDSIKQEKRHLRSQHQHQDHKDLSTSSSSLTHSKNSNNPNEEKTPSSSSSLLMEDLDAMDFEDLIDGQRVRFPYKKVTPTTYGLSIEEILELEDDELDRFVPIRKLAPYRSFQQELKDIQMKQRQVHSFRRELQLQKKATHTTPTVSGKSSSTSTKQVGSLPSNLSTSTSTPPPTPPPSSTTSSTFIHPSGISEKRFAAYQDGKRHFNKKRKQFHS